MVDRAEMLGRMDSDLLRYIVQRGVQPGERLPALEDLGKQLGVSVGKLREQLEVARDLGIVDVRPRVGVTVRDYSFLPAVRWSLLFALARGHADFDSFSNLRNHVEFAYFFEAVAALTDAEHARLREIVQTAWSKLRATPVRIPHAEHRELHMTVYSRLNNPFVSGLLEAYWEAYEAVGLSVYSDYGYLREVWRYHEGIVENIISGDRDEAYRLLVAHTRLLQHRADLPQAHDKERTAATDAGRTATSPSAREGA